MIFAPGDMMASAKCSGAYHRWGARVLAVLSVLRQRAQHFGEVLMPRVPTARRNESAHEPNCITPTATVSCECMPPYTFVSTQSSCAGWWRWIFVPNLASHQYGNLSANDGAGRTTKKSAFQSLCNWNRSCSNTPTFPVSGYCPKRIKLCAAFPVLITHTIEVSKMLGFLINSRRLDCFATYNHKYVPILTRYNQ